MCPLSFITRHDTNNVMIRRKYKGRRPIDGWWGLLGFSGQSVSMVISEGFLLAHSENTVLGLIQYNE